MKTDKTTNDNMLITLAILRCHSKLNHKWQYYQKHLELLCLLPSLHSHLIFVLARLDIMRKDDRKMIDKRIEKKSWNLSKVSYNTIQYLFSHNLVIIIFPTCIIINLYYLHFLSNDFAS